MTCPMAAQLLPTLHRAAATTGIAPTLPATERDNDSGAFAFSMTALTVAEGADTDYTVRLAYKPTATVTVSVATTGDPDLSALPANFDLHHRQLGTRRRP